MISAIILAAGRSRRMGVQKLLLPFGGRTVIGHIVGEVLRSPVGQTVVVVGQDGPRIAEALAGQRVELVTPQRHLRGGSPDLPREPASLGQDPRFRRGGSGDPPREVPSGAVVVTNPDPGGEMLSSVRCGLRALAPECEAVLVALGDQPSLTADLVGCMLDAYRAGGRGILVPTYGGKPGHPILFSMRYREEILTRYDAVGLRALCHAHPEDVLELGVASPSVLADMDYPEDYRRALAELAGDR